MNPPAATASTHGTVTGREESQLVSVLTGKNPPPSLLPVPTHSALPSHLSMAPGDLTRYGWNEYWAAVLADFAETAKRATESGAFRPGRVLRHHGVAVSIATAQDIEQLPLRRGLEVAPVVGDWVAVAGAGAGAPAGGSAVIVGVLPRRSLLERRASRGDASHPLVANVDHVLIACGLDRPRNAGRIRRCATIAWDAGATPAIVLTKADLWDRCGSGPTRSAGSVPIGDPPLAEVVEGLGSEHPNLAVLTTSSVTGTGLDDVRAVIGAGTAVLLGESGSGKSSLVNALASEPVAGTGAVRSRDHKGRHTTTTRELHPLPGRGVVVDTPGLRSIGIWADAETADTAFEDIAELAAGCRFRNCAHASEPGCAVRAAVEEDRLDPARLEAFLALRQET